jgi:hypothetical protein
MNTKEILFALSGYPLAAVAGFILGLIFGRKMVADVHTILASIESRVGALESPATASAVSPADKK